MTASALSVELLGAVAEMRPLPVRLHNEGIPAKLDRLVTAFAVQLPFYGRIRVGDGPRTTARIERIALIGRTIAEAKFVFDLFHDGRPDQRKETIHVPLLELTEFLVLRNVSAPTPGDS